MAKKILIADDDSVQRELYFELFSGAGYEVTAAVDGQDAWEKIQKDTPDVVFTGIQMPRMTGYELIDKLRKKESTESIPVIIFSHLGRDEDREKASKLSFVDFRVKGYDRPVTILKKVQELVSARPAETNFDPEEDDRQGFSVL